MRSHLPSTLILPGRFIGLALCACFALACETTPEERLASLVERELDDAPAWVLSSCNAYWEEGADSSRICGVGSMGGTRNIALARSAAMARARTEIARSLQLEVEAMLKDYQSNTAAGERFGAASDEQNVVDVSRQITEMALVGTELEDTWISRSGTIYTLMSLDQVRFETSLQEADDLPESVRQEVLERSGEAFRDLDRETGSIEEEYSDPVW